MEPRLVVIVVFHGVQSLDVTGPLEVFSGAARLTPDGDRGYRTILAAPHGDPVSCSSGITMVPHVSLEQVPARIDTLIVAGGAGTREALDDGPLIDWIRGAAGRSRRVASVCTGAFLLAEAGLLDGLRATTHWARSEALARRYPLVTVDPEPIFIREGNVMTSAGVTAGMDLALAMVEEDLGRDVALEIARWLVLFLRRPGGQAQFSAQLSGQLAQRSALRDLQRWIIEHPDAALSIEELAARVSLSPRHFARSFTAEVGVTPGRYVERVRVEAARRELEDGARNIAEIAANSGFGTTETMRRSFIRTLGVAPIEYRRRFESTATPAA